MIASPRSTVQKISHFIKWSWITKWWPSRKPQCQPTAAAGQYRQSSECNLCDSSHSRNWLSLRSKATQEEVSSSRISKGRTFTKPLAMWWSHFKVLKEKEVPVVRENIWRLQCDTYRETLERPALSETDHTEIIAGVHSWNPSVLYLFIF